MILLDAYSPVPIKYLLVEDAARYSYRELLLLRRLGRNITFLQYPCQEIIGHDPEQFSEIFPNSRSLPLTRHCLNAKTSGGHHENNNPLSGKPIN